MIQFLANLFEMIALLLALALFVYVAQKRVPKIAEAMQGRLAEDVWLRR